MQSEEGISRLLQAEKEAQKLVQAARLERKERLKAAKKEAKSEIDAVMAEKAEEFKKFREAHTTGTTKQQEELQKDTEAKIAAIEASMNSQSGEVVDMLIELVTKVKTVV